MHANPFSLFFVCVLVHATKATNHKANTTVTYEMIEDWYVDFKFNIDFFNFNQAPISDFESDAFSHVYMKHARHIQMNRNILERLSVGLLDSLVKLEELDLGRDYFRSYG